MPPSTRVQQREHTRQRLLDATVRCLVRHGHAGTTTQRIQDEAGVSRGALLHHFRSKDELFVAAVQHIANGQLRAIRERLTALDTSSPLVLADAFREAMSGPHFLAGLELWMSARTDAALRRVLTSAERALGAEIRALVEDLVGDRDDDWRLRYETLLVMLRGMALTSVLREDRRWDDAMLKWWAESL